MKVNVTATLMRMLLCLTCLPPKWGLSRQRVELVNFGLAMLAARMKNKYAVYSVSLSVVMSSRSDSKNKKYTKKSNTNIRLC